MEIAAVRQASQPAGRHPLLFLYRKINRLFHELIDPAEELFAPGKVSTAAWFANPHLTMTEKEGSIVVQVELPGVSQDDMTVSLWGNVLIVGGRKERQRW
jgi:HSP20 family molecular chaperone IbpA